MSNPEIGSDFYFTDAAALKAEWKRNTLSPLSAWKSQLYVSGRAALCHLLEYLVAQNKVNEVLLPAYYCEDVYTAVKKCAIKIDFYEDSPFHTWEETLSVLSSRSSEHTAVVLVNFWGIRSQPILDPVPGIAIEDHTHAPDSVWALNSQASYAFASLRKTMPLPYGGILWSPGQAALPGQSRQVPDPIADGIFADKLFAMVMKAQYLAGEAVNKSFYRECFASAEHQLEMTDSGPMNASCKELYNWYSGYDLSIPKRANYEYFRRKFRSNTCCSLVQPAGEDTLPLGIVLCCTTVGLRNELRTHLIQQHIYPAVLWPLETEEAYIRDISDRHLFIHCDFRYGQQDMDFLLTQLAYFIQKHE